MRKSRKSASDEDRTLEEKIRLYVRRRNDGKRAYARADKLFALILDEMKQGQSAAGYRLVNQYETTGKNTLFRSAGVSLLQLVEDDTA